MFSRVRKVAQQRGASPPQVWVIKILKERGGATPKELAEVMCVTPANVTGLVAKLERNGFVTRKRDRKDRRVVRLEATKKALLGLEAMQKAALASATETFAAWKTEEILALKAMLDRFANDAAEKSKGGATGARPRQPRRL